MPHGCSVRAGAGLQQRCHPYPQRREQPTHRSSGRCGHCCQAPLANRAVACCLYFYHSYHVLSRAVGCAQPPVCMELAAPTLANRQTQVGLTLSRPLRSCMPFTTGVCCLGAQSKTLRGCLRLQRASRCCLLPQVPTLWLGCGGTCNDGVV